MSERCHRIACGARAEKPIALTITDYRRKPTGADLLGKPYADWLEERVTLVLCDQCYAAFVDWMADLWPANTAEHVQ